MSKFLDSTGLVYFKGKIETLLSGKVDKETGKGLSTNDYTSAEKTKLSGIEANANNYTHPSHTAKASGLYKIVVDALGHVSGATAVAKSDITALGIPAQDTTYSDATTSVHGLMSTTDKTKLDGVEAGANNYSHPSHTAKSSGLYKVTVDALGHVSAATVVAKSDITGLGIPAQDTTYSTATGSANGLMSSTDKAKLDSFGAASSYALKTDIASMYKYKGSVATVSDLPASGNTTGDVYNVESNDMNYAWNGTAWDSLGGMFSIDAITNAEIDAMFT